MTIPYPAGAPMPVCAPPLPQIPVRPFTEYLDRYIFVGSRVTVRPPPLDTDQDVLCFVHEINKHFIEQAMLDAGFVREGSIPADLDENINAGNTFFSMRRGDMNYIVTSDETFYKRFSAATNLAKQYNLTTKEERVQLFQAVLYGNWVQP